MKFVSAFQKTVLITLLLALCVAASGLAFAGKGGNGQTGNGGGGGGNTSPDPEYAIHAEIVGVLLDCLAYNPNLKGPGIAYGGFYPILEVSPYTCALVDTGTDDFYIRTLGSRADENGLITAAWLTGRDTDGFLFDSPETPLPGYPNGFPAPTDGSHFTLDVNAVIEMTKCKKIKGKN